MTDLTAKRRSLRLMQKHHVERRTRMLFRQITMVIAFLGAACAADSASAGMITFGGRTYEAVDWDTANRVTETATGTIGGVGVTFNAADVARDLIETADYSTAPEFDALTFSPLGAGNLESVQVIGAFGGGTNTIDFGQQIASLLVFIGFPNDPDNQDRRQFGPSQWDFDDALNVTIVDTELSSSGATLQVVSGNIVDRVPDPASFQHISGVVRVEGASPFSLLSFDQVAMPLFTDTVNLTFAADFSQEMMAVPEPSSFVLLGIGMGAMGFYSFAKRRSQTQHGLLPPSKVPLKTSRLR